VVPPCFIRQNQPKKNYFLFVCQFKTTSKQKCSNLRPLLSITFPQGFQISKNIGHPTLGSGGKKTFKRYLKSEHTNRLTDRQTDGHADGHFDLKKASAQRADAFALKEQAKGGKKIIYNVIRPYYCAGEKETVH
jgi:hypothetical protein